MRALLKYTKSLSLGIASVMEYRMDFFLGMFSAVWPMLIQFFMWSSIYGGSQQAVMFGYTYAQMITYTVFANIVQRLLRTGFEYEINDDIKNGGLDKYIVRPVSYFQYRMASFLGSKLVHMLMIYGVLIAASLIINAAYGTVITPDNLVYFTLVLLLAFVLNFIIFFCVGMLAFWLSEVGFFFEAVRIVFIAFSGGIFPLDVFGPKVVSVLNWLPFKYTVNFPVDVLTGRMHGDAILQGCVVMCVWIAALSVFSRVIWKTGLNRYVAAGG